MSKIAAPKLAAPTPEPAVEEPRKRFVEIQERNTVLRMTDIGQWPPEDEKAQRMWTLMVAAGLMRLDWQEPNADKLIEVAEKFRSYVNDGV